MDKNNLNNDIFNRLTEYAAERSMEELPSSLPSDEALERGISLRPEFEKRMEATFRAAERKLKNLRRRRISVKIAVAVLATLVVFSTVVASVEALRVPLLNFFIENGDGFMTMHFSEDTAQYSDYAGNMAGKYLPSYLPDGYVVDQVDQMGDDYNVVYKDPQDNLLILHKMGAGSSLGIDTEDVVIETLSINGENAQYSEKHGLGTLIFSYEDNYFLLSGVVGKEKMIAIAESVRIFSN